MDALIKELIALKEKKDAVIEEYNALVAEVAKKYNESAHCAKLDEPTANGKEYVRVNIVDNMLALSKGETVWKSAGFSAYSVSVKYLKREPKEMKEVQNG